jgi:hypothetical protein
MRVLAMTKSERTTVAVDGATSRTRLRLCPTVNHGTSADSDRTGPSKSRQRTIRAMAVLSLASHKIVMGLNRVAGWKCVISQSQALTIARAISSECSAPRSVTASNDLGRVRTM